MIKPILPSQLGFDPATQPHHAPISLAEAQEIRNRIAGLQTDWKQVVAQAVAAANLAESFTARIDDLDMRLKDMVEISTKLNELSAKLDELDARTAPKPKKRNKP